MDDPNINSGRVPITFMMSGLAYATTWSCAAYLIDRPSPIEILHNALHPMAFGYAPPILGGVLALIAGAAAFKGLYIKPENHIRGIQLKDSVKELSSALKPLKNSSGIFIHPRITTASK